MGSPSVAFSPSPEKRLGHVCPQLPSIPASKRPTPALRHEPASSLHPIARIDTFGSLPWLICDSDDAPAIPSPRGMILDGVLAEHQLGRDLRVGEPAGS